jgi:hypothetical protein
MRDARYAELAGVIVTEVRYRRADRLRVLRCLNATIRKRRGRAAFLLFASTTRAEREHPSFESHMTSARGGCQTRVSRSVRD